MSNQERVVNRMKSFATQRNTSTLCDALELLAGKDGLTREESLTHAVLIDVLCDRYPAVDAAFDAWAETEETDGAVEIIVATARAQVQA